MLVVASNHHIEILLNSNIASSRILVESSAHIKDIAYHDSLSTLYWVTAAGVSRSNTGGQTLIYKLNNLLPTGLALDRATGNIYVSAVLNGSHSQDRSVIKVIEKNYTADVNIITTQTMVTDISLDSTKGLMFWSEHTKPYTGRIVRSTMDGRSTVWLYAIDKIMYPNALSLDPIKSRIYWSDIRLQSISSCDYSGQNQKLEVSMTNGQPLSISFFEDRISWSILDQNVIYSQVVNGNSTSQQRLTERVGHLLTVHSVLEPQLNNPCSISPCNNGLCLLKNSSSFTCHCPTGVAVVSSNPFRCAGRSPEAEATKSSSDSAASNSIPKNPDYEDQPSSPGVTVASILICLAILTILAILGWVYYRRWRRTIGSPLKFRFRNALGMTEESTAWEESVDYSDRKRLYIKSDDNDDDQGPGPHIMVDQNDNRTVLTPSAPRHGQTDSAYASQQSLVKNHYNNLPPEDHQPQQLLPATYSMKDQLLASEL